MSAGGAAWRWKRSNCACAGAASARQATHAATRLKRNNDGTNSFLMGFVSRGPYAPHLSTLSRIAVSCAPTCKMASTAAGGAVEHGDGATVLRPAGNVVTDRDRPLLAIADRPHARSGDALGGEIIVSRLRALRTQREIVFARAPLVGVALDGEAIFVILIEPRRLLVERRLGGLRKNGLVGVEEDAVADRLVEFLHAARAGRAVAGASGEVVGVVVGAAAQGHAERER